MRSPSLQRGLQPNQLGVVRVENDVTESPQERDAVVKAVAHTNTSTVVHLDPLGCSFLSIEDHGPFGKYETRSAFDILGNLVKVTDPRKNTVLAQQYDLLNHPIHRSQMDSGERTILLSAAGNPTKVWDSRAHLIETEYYDDLNWPTTLWVTELKAKKKRLAEQTIYGESQPQPEQRNLRGQRYQPYDGAGLMTFEQYDFKGNLLTSKRQILEDYKHPVDWSASPQPVFMADPPWAASAKYDALNRIQGSVTSDGSRTLPTYNEANLLKSLRVTLRGAETTTLFCRTSPTTSRASVSGSSMAMGSSPCISTIRRPFA